MPKIMNLATFARLRWDCLKPTYLYFKLIYVQEIICHCRVTSSATKFAEVQYGVASADRRRRIQPLDEELPREYNCCVELPISAQHRRPIGFRPLPVLELPGWGLRKRFKPIEEEKSLQGRSTFRSSAETRATSSRCRASEYYREN